MARARRNNKASRSRRLPKAKRTSLYPQNVMDISSASIIRIRRAYHRLGSYRFNGVRSSTRSSINPSSLVRRGNR